MNIFITGAAGFIGKSFLKTLLLRIGPEDNIFILVRAAIQCADKRVSQLIGTLATLHDFEEIIISSDYFFHIAAESNLKGSGDYAKTNIEATRDIVDMLKKGRRLRNMVFISSIAAVGRSPKDACAAPINLLSAPFPVTPYGRSKLAAENIITESGLPYTIIRPAFVYGKNMRPESHINKFVSMVCKRSPFVHFNFPGKISLVHVDDLSAALANCVNNNSSIGKIYFAETETSTTGDIFRIIYGHIRHRRLRQFSVPRFYSILRRIHALMPPSLVFLFLDYLWAHDEQFRSGLLKGITIRNIDENIDDVISTNSTVSQNISIFRKAA